MTEVRDVLVGLGGNDDTALVWAAQEAVSRNCDLQVLRTYPYAAAALPWSSPIDRQMRADLHAAATLHLKAALSRVRVAHPGLTVSGSTAQSDPARALLRRSESFALTVLGSRRLGLTGSIALGSVSCAVTARARRPVTVVGSVVDDSARRAPVIVGVDGGPGTEDVLAFAFDYADRHRRNVHALHCWYPDLLSPEQWLPGNPAPAMATEWLAETVAGWAEKYPTVRLHTGVRRSHPMDGLVDAAVDSALLVVGSRSRHPRLSALGSVSQGVLHHATCPVTVVPTRPE